MNKAEYKVLLAGNPNVGKSTLFNALTGLKQHTGNWSGKTVEHAIGHFRLGERSVTLCDLPGTYSLSPCSAEEVVAVDSICYEEADAVIVVGDATSPLRSISFALQVAQVRGNVIFCLNLADEARKQRTTVDTDALSQALGMPVLLTAVRKEGGRGLTALREVLAALFDRKEQALWMSYGEADPYLERCEALLKPYCSVLSPRWAALTLLENDLTRVSALAERLDLPSDCLFQLDHIVTEWLSECKTDTHAYFTDCRQAHARLIAESSVQGGEKVNRITRKLDRVILGRWTSIPCMILLMAGLLWISLVGANFPSSLLSELFASIEGALRPYTALLPWWLDGLWWDGGWRLLTWVTAVMLPPMAIFFPLFTLLEDFGLLPRMAFVTDTPFAAVGCSGKQMLTMCMSIGCTCTGVMGTRIIECPKQRRIAQLTATFMPCNGRFPLLLALITLFSATGSAADSLTQMILLILLLAFAMLVTLVVSKVLQVTINRRSESRFVMELPTYRVPQVGKVLVRSLIDRTLRMLSRAAVAALPAGLLIWLICHVSIGGQTLLQGLTDLLDPLGCFLGMDGAILTSFLLGIPANEIVLPILLLCYSGSGTLLPVDGLSDVYAMLVDHGWTAVTALCTGIFCICHFPCLTALRTVAKESGSVKTALISALLPTAVGMLLCFTVRILSELC